MVGRPFWRTGRGRYVIPEVREWSGGPFVGQGVVGRQFRRSVSSRYVISKEWRGRDTHPEVQEGSGDPPGGTRGIGRPTRRSSRGRNKHPVVHER